MGTPEIEWVVNWRSQGIHIGRQVFNWCMEKNGHEFSGEEVTQITWCQ